MKLLQTSVLILTIKLIYCENSELNATVIKSELPCYPAYITLSPLLPGTKIILNWNFTHCSVKPDTIVLLNKTPIDNITDTNVLFKLDISDMTDTSYKTNVDLMSNLLPGNWSWSNNGTKTSGPLCLPYWIVAYKLEKMLYSDCFKIQPTWMDDKRHIIGEISLTSLFIPGTHNSACDKIRVPSKTKSTFVDRWALTQDQDIWNQLVYGIRYLDLRVGHYVKEMKNDDPDTGFWINHGFVQIRPLKEVLVQIREFIQHAPEEVVIVDFHRFPIGFNGRQGASNHKKLIRMIYRELGEHLIRRPDNESLITLNDIWNCSKRIILNYNQDSYVNEVPWLWNSVSQMWGDKQSPQDLKEYLHELYVPKDPSKDELKGTMWAAMAELTHKISDLLDSGSLRIMADGVNKELSNWYLNNKNWSHNANIVATDYFLGNKIIDIAITMNLEKGRGKGSDELGPR